MQGQIDRKDIRARVRKRIRRKISGTPARPRLAVFRSVKHIYVQAIDDSTGRTVAHASTLDAAISARSPRGCNIEAAKLVGGAIAEKLLAAGVEAVVLDRGGFLYHGRIKALADAARAGGLKF